MSRLARMAVTGFLLTVAAAPLSAQSISKLSATSVSLIPGGPPVSLVVEGSQLDAVTSALGIRSGTNVSGLTATISSKSGSRVTLNLRAAASLAPGTYQLAIQTAMKKVGLPIEVKVGGDDSTFLPSPTVTGASPSAVNVRAGGAQASVSVSGTSLNHIVGAYVERNGVRLSNVLAQLGTSTGNQREVRLSALSSAGPPFGYDVDVFLEGRLGTGSGKFRVPAKITVQPPSIDLVVSSCRMDIFAASVQITSVIRNNGQDPAPFQTNQAIAWFTASNNPNTHNVVNAPGGGVLIPPGGTIERTRSHQFPGPGPFTVVTTVNPHNDVFETNSNNNERSCTVTIPEPPASTPAPIADLLITSITAQPASGPAGTNFVFRINLSNSGTASAGSASIPLVVECRIDNGNFTGSRWSSISALAAGGSVAAEVTAASASFVPGTKTIECTADPANTVSESNNTNNRRSTTFTVTTG